MVHSSLKCRLKYMRVLLSHILFEDIIGCAIRPLFSKYPTGDGT
jgi:hypothetical protein